MTDEKDKPGTESTNVVPLKDKMKEKASKDIGDKKVGMIASYRLIRDVINNEKKRYPYNGAWTKNFFLFEPEPGVRRILIEKPGRTVAYCDEEAVTSSILTFCHKMASAKEKYFMYTPRNAAECMNYWKLTTAPLKKEPKLIAQKSDDELAFNRLDFDIDDNTIWDSHIESKDGIETFNSSLEMFEFLKIFSRCKNWRALAAFIGSLFYENSDREQYLYLHGDGENGKSTLVRFLKRLLGSAYHSDDPTQSKSQFWTSSFINKRLVVFPDCNSPSFAQTGLFKSLTGNDPVRIEQKQKHPFTAELNCKFIFLSNEKLQIKSTSADLRRAIFVEMKQINKNQRLSSRKIDKQLWHDRQNFIDFCCWCFRRETRDEYSKIKTDNSAEELAEEFEESYDMILEKYFIMPDERQIIEDEQKSDRMKEFVTTPADLQIAMKMEKMKPREVQLFKDWIQRKYGVEKKTFREIGGKVVRKYVGIKVDKTRLW